MRKLTERKGVQFNCFSPGIMIFTLVVEVSMAVYTIWRYKLTAVTRLIVAALLALATFQLAEYFVCTETGSGVLWSRVGFAAITLLPPLGLHIMHRLAGKTDRRLLTAAYGTMAAFVSFFLLYESAFTGQECTGNYVIFQIGYEIGGIYAAYYYGWLLTAIGLGVHWANQLVGKKSKAARTQLQAIRAMILGYLVFLLPTALTNTVNPQTTDGIPSIMCGFAILFALILGLYILPRAGKPRA